MNKTEAKAAMVKLLRDHVKEQRKRHEAAVKRTEKIGMLQSKLIYMAAMGKLPVEQVEAFDGAVDLVLEDA